MYAEKLKKIDVLQEQINQLRPLKKQELLQLKEYYRIGLTYTSNALEGNSLTETETKIVLEEGITIGGKLLKDHYEAVGHSQAFDLVYKLAKRNDIAEKDILKLHKLFYLRIDPKQAGKYRKKQVFITGTTYVPPVPSQVPELMKKFVVSIPTLKANRHPVEHAALIHKEFVSIHPFVDGNGRCARLLMNLDLLQSGYVITQIPPIRRSDYISTIKQTQVQPKDDTPFIAFIADMVYESQKDYLRMFQTLGKNE